MPASTTLQAPASTTPRDVFAPLWLSKLDAAIRLGDAEDVQLYLPKWPPYTLARQVFRDVSPLLAAFETGRWGTEVLAVACEDEKAQVLVSTFTQERIEHHSFYREIWQATDKGALLRAALESPRDDALLSALLARVNRLPRALFEEAYRMAIAQRRPALLGELIAWNRRGPTEDQVEAAFRTHDPAIQQAVIARVSDHGMSVAVAEAASTGDLRALDQIAAGMEARGFPEVRRRRLLAKTLSAAIERSDEPLWRWALPRADINHNKGQALRDAVERACLPWAEELLEKGARPHLAFCVWRDANRWEPIHILARLVTAKQRAPWLRSHPDAMAPIQAWEREQRALARLVPLRPPRLRQRA